MTFGSWTVLLTAGAFTVLASYSLGKYHPDAKPERIDLMAFVDQKLESYSPRPQPVVLWKADAKADFRRKQAATLAMVYGITTENADSYREWW